MLYSLSPGTTNLCMEHHYTPMYNMCCTWSIDMLLIQQENIFLHGAYNYFLYNKYCITHIIILHKQRAVMAEPKSSSSFVSIFVQIRLHILSVSYPDRTS